MSTADYLIKNVSLPDGKKTDLAISDGVITSLAESYKGEAQTVIDAQDCVVLPGLVDLHTHLREPGRGCRNRSEWKSSRCKGGIHRRVGYG